jgi:hypothetical protein
MSRSRTRPTTGGGPTTPAQSGGADPGAPAASSAGGTPASSGPAAAREPAGSTGVTEPTEPTEPTELSEVSEAGAATPPGEPWGGWQPIVRAGGFVVAIVFAFVSGVVELLLSTLRAGDFVSIWHGDPIGSGSGPLIPLSVVLAVVGNLGVAWFAVGTTGRRWALGPPWALWTVVMLIAAGVRTHEGDYLLSGTNYVALAMILIGSLTFAIYTYRMILQRIPPAVSTSAAPRKTPPRN